jgi:hypothetical protein
MKTSNLALRVDFEEPDTPGAALELPATDEVIQDDGLRPFRVR